MCAKREYFIVGEDAVTEIWGSKWVETPWEKFVRLIQFKDIDPDIPMNKYSFPRRVYWTLHFKINYQWIPRLQGHKLYSVKYTVQVPKNRELITRKIRMVDEVRDVQ